MQSVLRGMFAGFVATVVLSVLMAAKARAGLMPDLDVIAMLADIAHRWTGVAERPLIGWLLHFLIGTVAWGTLFALLMPRIYGRSYWLKGVVFSLGAWVAMMAVFMPVARAGVFASELGVAAPAVTLVLHIVFGAVIGHAWIPGDLRREIDPGGPV